jgi:hypothetical protein
MIKNKKKILTKLIGNTKYRCLVKTMTGVKGLAININAMESNSINIRNPHPNFTIKLQRHAGETNFSSSV